LNKSQLLVQKLNESKNLLYKNSDHLSKYDPEVLSGPKHKREEIKQIKQALDQFKDYKENHISLGKRERTIKWGWRHGITGIENSNSANISVFYEE
jgi:hypothetical protein